MSRLLWPTLAVAAVFDVAYGGKGTGRKRGTPSTQTREVTATTWNAAEFDDEFKEKTQPQDFVREIAKHRDFVLLQEVMLRHGQRSKVSEAVRSNDRQLVTCHKRDRQGVTKRKCYQGVAYNSREWKHREWDDESVGLDDKGERWASSFTFEHTKNGVRVAVINVHAGHPKTEKEQEEVLNKVKELIRTVRPKVDVVITGGDFNEACRVTTAWKIGRGGDSVGPTCGDGTNDRIGVMEGGRSSFEVRGHSKMGRKFGSDHSSVDLYVKMTKKSRSSNRNLRPPGNRNRASSSTVQSQRRGQRARGTFLARAPAGPWQGGWRRVMGRFARKFRKSRT